MDLFGGSKHWNADDWTASDDRVRGGKSQSYFDCSDSKSIGRFHGDLDIKALGGAGFASQRTTGEDRVWDLSAYAGIEVQVAEADGKHYTFILKDELLPRNPENGREQATISYEYDFGTETVARAKGMRVFIPWKALKPTYRGKEKKDASAIDLKNVKRMSIMMRSFFGDQEGPFSLAVRSITAVKHSSKEGAGAVRSLDDAKLEKGEATQSAEPRPSFIRRFLARYRTTPARVGVYVVLNAAALYLLYRSTFM